MTTTQTAPTPIMDATPTTFEHVTVYTSGSFGYVGTVCRRAVIREGQWAQYSDAVAVTMLEPRKRNVRGVVKSDRGVVIVAGKGPTAPVPMFSAESTANGVTTSHSIARSCDPSWETKFAAWLAECGLTVLADYRRAA